MSALAKDSALALGSAKDRASELAKDVGVGVGLGAPPNDTLTTAPLVDTETTLIEIPRAESVNVWPAPNDASRNVVVAGCPSSSSGRTFERSGATRTRTPFTAESPTAKLSKDPNGWRNSR